MNAETLWRGLVHAKLFSISGLVRLLFLWPVALLYQLGAVLARTFSSNGARFSVPVISVGNLTVGGTGKTPFVGWLAERLIEEKKSVGIVCSGYGRRGREYFCASGRELQKRSATEIGDEVALLTTWVPSAHFAVAERKADAVKSLADSGEVDLILVDDGFQTRNLWRDLDIVLLNTQAPKSEYRPFPAGALRQSVSALTSADVVIFTKLNSTDDSAPEWLEEMVSSHHSSQPVAHTALEFEIAGVCEDWSQPTSEAPALLVSAVADNPSVASAARGLGVELAEKIEFSDHFLYDETAVEKIRKTARDSGAGWIVTTEKDWMKLRDFSDWPLPFAVIRQRLFVSQKDSDQIISRILETL